MTAHEPAATESIALRPSTFLGRSATGIGTAALASRCSNVTDMAASRLSERTSRVWRTCLAATFCPKAKRVIYLFQNGAPTHVDLFDWKPNLKKMHKHPVPMSYIGDRRFSTMTGKADGKLLLAPIEPFAQHGRAALGSAN